MRPQSPRPLPRAKNSPGEQYRHDRARATAHDGPGETEFDRLRFIVADRASDVEADRRTDEAEDDEKSERIAACPSPSASTTAMVPFARTEDTKMVAVERELVPIRP